MEKEKSCRAVRSEPHKSQPSCPGQSWAFLAFRSLSSLLCSKAACELWAAPRGEAEGTGSHGQSTPCVCPSLILQMSSDQARSTSRPAEQSPASDQWECEIVGRCSDRRSQAFFHFFFLGFCLSLIWIWHFCLNKNQGFSCECLFLCQPDLCVCYIMLSLFLTEEKQHCVVVSCVYLWMRLCGHVR